MPGPAVDIVRATAADIPFILATERTPGYEGLVGRWERAQHEQALAEASNAYFIGCADGKPIGFVIVQHWASDDRATLIKRIIVADAGKRLGRVLLSGVIAAIFAQTQASRIWLYVHPHNARAQRCYSALGLGFEERVIGTTSSDAGQGRMLMMVLRRSQWQRGSLR